MHHFYRKTKGRVPIGVGGVSSADDAHALIRRGSLVRPYTAVYHGPGSMETATGW